MTPQLQQAIRLLQLSTLDLKQEIQDALDSNLMLETEDEGEAREGLNGHDQESQASATRDLAESEQATKTKEADVYRELNREDNEIPEDLPVDINWDDVYESSIPQSSGSSGSDQGDTDYLALSHNALTLNDHLIWQLNLTPFSDQDREIATAIIDGINEDGYLSIPLEDLATDIDSQEIDLDEIEAVLHRIQQFDPPGVAARDPRECLLIQLNQLPEQDSPYRQAAIKLIRDHFDLLANQDLNQIKRKLKIDDDQLREIHALIRSLNPRPGTQISEVEPEYVTPDVFVSKHEEVWRVELNPDATPKLRVNSDYSKLIRRADNSHDNQYLKNHLQEARWFIKSLTSRNETLLRVASKIVEFQRGFFEYGEEAMKPLVLRDIAEALEMHESTISRVTTQKYMHTPRGTLEFKYFFSSHVSTTGGGECSATAIRALIKKLIAAEKPKKPLSDNKIAGILAEQGIEVARRTVAKYREAMAIPPSNERKRLV